MKVLFLTGNSQYSAFDCFLSDMMSDLEEMNCSSDVCRYVDGESYPDIKLNQYDKIISFNGIGLNISAADGSIKQFDKSKTLVWLLDHPIHLLPRIIGFPVTILCMDKEHVPFCQLCGLQAYYFPHSVSLISAAKYIEETRLIDEYEDKTKEIIMPISYFDAAEQKQKLEPVWHRLKPAIDSSENITDFLQHIGVLPIEGRGSVTQLNQDIFNICTVMNMYLRAIGRTSLMKLCAESGLIINVIGRDVHRYKESFPNFAYSNEMTMNELNQKVSKASYVVHNTPGFRQGLHDRPLNAMLRGTLVITDSNFMISEFPSACIAVKDITDISKHEYINRITQARDALLEKHTWYFRYSKLFRELN